MKHLPGQFGIYSDEPNQETMRKEAWEEAKATAKELTEELGFEVTAFCYLVFPTGDFVQVGKPI